MACVSDFALIAFQFSRTAGGETDGLEVLDECQNYAIMAAFVAHTPASEKVLLMNCFAFEEHFCST